MNGPFGAAGAAGDAPGAALAFLSGSFSSGMFLIKSFQADLFQAASAILTAPVNASGTVPALRVFSFGVWPYFLIETPSKVTLSLSLSLRTTAEKISS